MTAGDDGDGEVAEEAPKNKATRGRKAKKATAKSDGMYSDSIFIIASALTVSHRWRWS